MTLFKHNVKTLKNTGGTGVALRRFETVRSDRDDRNVAQSLSVYARNVAPEVLRDFGWKFLQNYSTERQAKSRLRMASVWNVEPYVIMDLDSGDAIGVASISPHIPQPVVNDEPTRRLLEGRFGVDKDGNVRAGYFGTYWFGRVEGRSQDVVSLQVASLLVPRMLEVASADEMLACALVAPVGVADITSGMRPMLPIVALGATQWQAPAYNHRQPLQLRVAA